MRMIARDEDSFDEDEDEQPRMSSTVYTEAIDLKALENYEQNTRDLAMFDIDKRPMVQISDNVVSVTNTELLLSFLSACAFVGRGGFIYISQKGHGPAIGEIAKAFAIAYIYILIGIVTPLWSKRISTSTGMERILTIRDAYRAEKYESWSQFLFVAKLSWPIGMICGCAAPVLSTFQLVKVHCSDAGTYVDAKYSGFIFALLFGWFVSCLVFGSVKLDEAALEATVVCIRGIRTDIVKHDKALHVIDEELGWTPSPEWSKVAQRIVKLHEVMLEIWDAHSAGGLWLARIILLLLASIAMAAVAVGHPLFFMAQSFRVVGITFAAAAITLTWQLAKVTNLCTDPLQKDSLLSTVLAHLGRDGTDANYHSLRSWLQTQSMGISLAGIRVTGQLALNMASNLLVYVPLASVILGKLLYPDSPKSEH